MLKYYYFLVLLFYYYSFNIATYNEITKEYLTNSFLEIGFSTIYGNNYVNIKTSIVIEDPIIFLSIPTTPLVNNSVWTPRLDNIQRDDHGYVSFNSIILQPEGNLCPNKWQVPPSSSQISSRVLWMVAERGVFRMFDKMIVISKGIIAHPSPIRYSQDNIYHFDYPTGCDGTEESCSFPLNTIIGAITQLQTMINNRYLLIRAFNIARRFSKFYMSSFKGATLEDEVVENEEILGYFIFDSTMSGRCNDGASFEAAYLTNITSIPVFYRYKLKYDDPPGTFGMVSSVVGLDPVGLRVLSTTGSAVTVLMEEDKCHGNDAFHSNPETLSLFTIGDATLTNVNVNDSFSSCFIVYNYSFTFEPTGLPTFNPSISFEPTFLPSNKPSLKPTYYPSQKPTFLPTKSPSVKPTLQPTKSPTLKPTLSPTSPTRSPTNLPTSFPTISPSFYPTYTPSFLPSFNPSSSPTNIPSIIPSTLPSTSPTNPPSFIPSFYPTFTPTFIPSTLPTLFPSSSPTFSPTNIPSFTPSALPTITPSFSPSILPTIIPSTLPSTSPTYLPSTLPTLTPSNVPTFTPSYIPTISPTLIPSYFPTITPSNIPTFTPSILPTNTPSNIPSFYPTNIPTFTPSYLPTTLPSLTPSYLPTLYPSYTPTILPSFLPTTSPTITPSFYPTYIPSNLPSFNPSTLPTISPSSLPSFTPTYLPTISPSILPTNIPTTLPSTFPTNFPTIIPSILPSNIPSSFPTILPSFTPTTLPSSFPTEFPSFIPSNLPTEFPTTIPSFIPSFNPSSIPSSIPSITPSFIPSIIPTEYPSFLPSTLPSIIPTSFPTNIPTSLPTTLPSSTPTVLPSTTPTILPSNLPSIVPSILPSNNPTTIPTLLPSNIPTDLPSYNPTEYPTIISTKLPTIIPTELPTIIISTLNPTILPTINLTELSTSIPSNIPTIIPTLRNYTSNNQTINLTSIPSILPTLLPSQNNNENNSTNLSQIPSLFPTLSPSNNPSLIPTLINFNTPIPSSKSPTKSPIAISQLFYSLCLFRSSFPSLNWNCSDLSYADDVVSICNEWPSIVCDTSYHLSGLNLKGLLNSPSQTLPDIFHEMIFIEQLNISSNSLIGPLPQTFNLLKSLITLDLSLNNFGIQNIQNISQRKLLDIDDSNELFTIISNLTNLKYLDIHENSIIGQLPSSLCSLPLETLIAVKDTDRIQFRNNFTCIAKCLIDNQNLKLEISPNLPICESSTIFPTFTPSIIVIPNSNNIKTQSISSLVIALPIIIFFILLFICIIIYWLIISRKEKKEEKQNNIIEYHEQNELSKMTIKSTNEEQENTIEDGANPSIESGQDIECPPNSDIDKQSNMSEKGLERKLSLSSFISAHYSNENLSNSSSDSEKESNNVIPARVISQKTSNRSPSTLQKFIPRSSSSLVLEELRNISTTPPIEPSDVKLKFISSPASSVVSDSSENSSQNSRKSRLLLRSKSQTYENISYHRPSLKLVQLSRSNSTTRSKPILLGRNDVIDHSTSEEDDFFTPHSDNSEDDEYLRDNLKNFKIKLNLNQKQNENFENINQKVSDSEMNSQYVNSNDRSEISQNNIIEEEEKIDQ